MDSLEYLTVKKPVISKLRGVTAFSLPLRDTSYIRAFIERVLEHNYNLIIVGSETADWGGVKWLPKGPPVEGQEAVRNLSRLLTITNDYPHLTTQIISSFTIKARHHSHQQAWAKRVVKVCSPFKRIIIRAVNEPHVHASISDDELLTLIDILKHSFHPVSVDQPAEGGSWRYPEKLKRVVDYLDMHTRRNPDLNSAELRNLAHLNGKVLLSETTSFLSKQNLRDFPHLRNNPLFYLNGLGTEKGRMAAAKSYMKRVKAVPPLRWCFHSLDLIKCNTLDFWLPKWK